MTKDHNSIKKFRRLALTASILVYIVIVMGGIVRATGLGQACQGWPLCEGSLFPPLSLEAGVAYLHRLDTVLLVLVLGGAAYLARQRLRGEAWLRRPIYAALGLVGIQILLGAVIALRNQPADLSALHLGLSLLVQALVVIPAVAAFYLEKGALSLAKLAEKHATIRLSFRSPFGRLSLWTLAAAFLLLVSGAVVSGSQSGQACTSWPFCQGSVLPADAAGWVNLVHQVMVLVTGALLTVQTLKAWRTQRSQTPVLVAATAAFVLFFAQALMGAYKVLNGYPVYMISIHEATAAGTWVALVILTTASGLAGRTAEDEQTEAAALVGRRGLARDLLMLTKPIVVALLLVTTFAGIVIGAQAWPSFSLVFWTILGGAMAAGGSSAINQYIDRVEDSKMQRTERRPIPSGRLTPAEGLAFGVGLALASFYVMVAFVNLLAALLTLAGIIYYVLIYSIFLKKATVQNIVIGGGAGAIPPLVGWAAATGSSKYPVFVLYLRWCLCGRRRTSGLWRWCGARIMLAPGYLCCRWYAAKRKRAGRFSSIPSSW
jgi:heme o synthase